MERWLNIVIVGDNLYVEISIMKQNHISGFRVVLNLQLKMVFNPYPIGSGGTWADQCRVKPIIGVVVPAARPNRAFFGG